MPEADKFEQLAPSRKRLVDTVKMIAYRAETAMAILLRESLAREDDAHSLLRDHFRSDADLMPDEVDKTVRVRVHPLANPRSNRAIAKLLEHLNETEFTYPGTELKLIYSPRPPTNSENGIISKSVEVRRTETICSVTQSSNWLIGGVWFVARRFDFYI